MSTKIRPGKMLYISIVILVILTCLPLAQVFPSIIRQSLQILSMGLFVVGLFLQNDKKLTLVFMGLFLFYFFFVYGTFQFTQNLVTCLFNTMTGVAFVIYGLYLLNNKKDLEGEPNKLLYLVIIIFIITSITTLIGLQKYPLAVRELGRSGVGYGYGMYGDVFRALQASYKRMNIATWSIAYGLALLVPQFIVLFKKSRKKIYLFFLILCEICIVASQLTIGVILSMLGIILLLYEPSRKGKDVVALLVLSILALILIFFMKDILLFVVNLASKNGMTFLSEKMKDALTLLNGTVGGDVLSRFELYSKDIDLFLKHPVFGQSIWGVSDGMFGLHSDFFGMLGYYGIFGLAILIFIVIRYFLKLKRSVEGNKWLLTVICILLLILFVLNPIWYSPQVFLTAILVPITISISVTSDYRSKVMFSHGKILIRGKNVL